MMKIQLCHNRKKNYYIQIEVILNRNFTILLLLLYFDKNKLQPL